MAIPSQQIGWSQKAKLLWNISKQLEKLTQVTGSVVIPTSATIDIYSNELSFPINSTSMVLRCDNSGNNIGNYIYTGETVNDLNELVDLFNTNPATSAYGTYSATIDGLKLTTSQSLEACCFESIIYMDIFND